MRKFTIVFPGVMFLSVVTSWIVVDVAFSIVGIDIAADILGVIAFYTILLTGLLLYERYLKEKDEEKAKEQAKEPRDEQKSSVPEDRALSVDEMLEERRRDYEAKLEAYEKHPNGITHTQLQRSINFYNITARHEEELRERERMKGANLVPIYHMTREEWIAAGRPEHPIPERDIPGRTVSDSKISQDNGGR